MPQRGEGAVRAGDHWVLMSRFIFHSHPLRVASDSPQKGHPTCLGVVPQLLHSVRIYFINCEVLSKCEVCPREGKGQCSFCCMKIETPPQVWGRMDTCICMAESLHCSPGTITTLFIGYTPIQNVLVLKKERELIM